MVQAGPQARQSGRLLYTCNCGVIPAHGLQALRRPLHYAIVDEADAQLVDHATSPFLISTDAEISADCTQRLHLADKVCARDLTVRSCTWTRRGTSAAHTCLAAARLWCRHLRAWCTVSTQGPHCAQGQPCSMRSPATVE